MNKVLEEFLLTYIEGGVIVGIGLELLVVLILIGSYKMFRNTSGVVFFDMFFEKVYEFFEDILGRDEKKWIKLYIVGLFFIILLSNLMGIIVDFVSPMLSLDQKIDNYIKIPTADINFNVAMAIIGVVIVIVEQFKSLKFFKTIYEYFPIFGKGYIPYTRGNLPAIIDWPLFLIIKAFDIVISMFLGILDIVGHLAKVISLSFRLFGNMTSGTLLLTMLFGALIGLTSFVSGITGVEGDGFPIVGPIILYLQGLLVTFIQALVFPLLIAIFVKVARIG